MVTMNEIWTEKYRPKTLDDVVGQKHVTERLKSYVASRNIHFANLFNIIKTFNQFC